MIAVIFEVYPADGRKEEYLDIAAGLRPILQENERDEAPADSRAVHPDKRTGT